MWHCSEWSHGPSIVQCGLGKSAVFILKKPEALEYGVRTASILWRWVWNSKSISMFHRRSSCFGLGWEGHILDVSQQIWVEFLRQSLPLLLQCWVLTHRVFKICWFYKGLLNNPLSCMPIRVPESTGPPPGWHPSRGAGLMGSVEGTVWPQTPGELKFWSHCLSHSGLFPSLPVV